MAKYWKKELLRIAFLGLENETGSEKDMVLRMPGYDGAQYRTLLFCKTVGIKNEEYQEYQKANHGKEGRRINDKNERTDGDGIQGDFQEIQ